MDQETKSELHNVLSMSLYDIMNNLCSQMMEKNIDKDWIGFDAHNGIDHRKYRLRVCLEVIE